SRAARGREPRGDGPRRQEDARQTAVLLHQPQREQGRRRDRALHRRNRRACSPPQWSLPMRSVPAATPAALPLAPVLIAAPADAHTGHGLEGFAAGLAHPLLGVDHLLAMIAVGAWSAQQGGRAVWLLPSAFVGVMATGGAIGLTGVGLAGTESV